MNLAEKNIMREELLMTALNSERKLEISRVMELLGVSKSTARRILMQLEEKGLIVRTHGGAHLLTNDNSFDPAYMKYVVEKKRIGERACSYLEPGDIVFIDSGTTAQCFALALAEQIRAKQVPTPVLFTNSIVNVDILSEVTPITLIGGDRNPLRKAFYGYLAKHSLEILHFTKSFLGTDGIDTAGRLYAADFPEAEISRTVAERSDCIILMCDHSKFNVKAMAQWSTLQSVDYVIVDNGINSSDEHIIESTGCKIVKV